MEAPKIISWHLSHQLFKMRQMKISYHYFSPHHLDRFLSTEYWNSQVSEAVGINSFESKNDGLSMFLFLCFLMRFLHGVSEGQCMTRTVYTCFSFFIQMHTNLKRQIFVWKTKTILLILLFDTFGLKIRQLIIFSRIENLNRATANFAVLDVILLGDW